jgi:hypothetical protein
MFKITFRCVGTLMFANEGGQEHLVAIKGTSGVAKGNTVSEQRVR